MSPRDRFQLMLDPEQLEELRELQEETGAPISEQIRRAIDAYLAKAKASRSTKKK